MLNIFKKNISLSKDELESFMQKIINVLCMLFQWIRFYLVFKKGNLKNGAKTQNKRSTKTVQTYMFMQNNDHFESHTCTTMQPPKKHWGPLVSSPFSLFQLFRFCFFWVPVLVINCPFSLAFDMVFPFKMNKEYVILQIFLISSMWACIILQPQTDIHEQKYMYWYIQESKECANINTEESTIQNCF